MRGTISQNSAPVAIRGFSSWYNIPMHSLAATEARLRDTLLATVLPVLDGASDGVSGGDRPGLGDLDLSAFWARFQVVAPLHLRLALRVATWGVGAFLPCVLLAGTGLVAMDAPAREALIQRAARLPLFADLLEVSKLVATLAYFSDPAVQDRTRGRT